LLNQSFSIVFNCLDKIKTLNGVLIFVIKDTRKTNVEAEETDDDNMPAVSLQEMLDDMHIADDPMGEAE
jgi:hypothetical protein